MAQLSLTRNGAFRAEDIGAVEGRLRAVPANGPVTGYLSGTNMLFIFPNGLTAPQQTAAQSIINAHVALTDNAQLSPQQRALVTYHKLASPTTAQNTAQIKLLTRMLIAMTSGKSGTVDGVNLDLP